MSKFKVGDKVRVKEDLKSDTCYQGVRFAKGMECYRGKVFTIAHWFNFIDNTDGYYLAGIKCWEFNNEMLEPVRQKYTLQECYDKGWAIHCDTEEKANSLLNAMSKKGWTWLSGFPYTEKNYYIFKEKETCYLPKEGIFSSLRKFKDKGYKIIWFDDVILPKKEEPKKEEPKPILDKAEHDYLENIIKPYKKYELKGSQDKMTITKERYGEGQRIRITYPFYEYKENGEVTLLPIFPKGSMYELMEQGRHYSLEELGL